MTTLVEEMKDMPRFLQGYRLFDALIGWKRINFPTYEALQGKIRKSEDYSIVTEEETRQEGLLMSKAYKFKKIGPTKVHLQLRGIKKYLGSSIWAERDLIVLEKGTNSKRTLKDLTEI